MKIEIPRIYKFHDLNNTTIPEIEKEFNKLLKRIEALERDNKGLRELINGK
jgi:cell shape-determining protein MreC